MNNEKILDISWAAILKIGIAVICFYLLYLIIIKDILIWFVFALIISILFNPAIDFLQRRRIPRVAATFLVYVTIFVVLGIFVYFITSAFIAEIGQFFQVLPQYFEKIVPILGGLGIEVFKTFEEFVLAFQKEIEAAAVGIFSALVAIFGGIFATISIFILAFFLSLEEKGVERTFSFLFPKKYEAYALNLWERCQRKVSGWFGARLLTCFFVGVLCYITFLFFNVKYPLALGLLAGVLNFIPIIGPIVAGFLIFLLVALDSISQAILVLIVFILIQQIENNILTPVLTKKFIGLPPILVLIALLIGGKLWGILGAILAIPLAGILFEFLKEFLQKKREEEKAVIL